MTAEPARRPRRRRPTATSAFGVGRRESHDASGFYARFTPPALRDDDTVVVAPDLGDGCLLGDSRDMSELPDNCVALVVTSPPYFVGKEYEDAVHRGEIPETYGAYLEMLTAVFAECARVLEPGGRIAVNVANLGRKPYRSLSGDVTRILEELGLLPRGEIVWRKGRGTSGSCAWGSFRQATNPVLRDTTERVLVASKGRFDRAQKVPERRKAGLPWQSTLSADEFMDATLDVWEIDAESARRVNHPAPFPVELARRLIELYTYRDDLVLDPFLGSGSTVVAAARTGRRGVGYDLDPTYVQVARDRLASEGAPDASSPAVDEGKKARDIAERVLREAGFRMVRDDPSVRELGVQFSFEVEGSDGRSWYVDVAGSFTNLRPGLQRQELVWKTIARAAALRGGDAKQRVLVLTPSLPKSGSEGDRALRAGGRAAGLFDVVELYDPAGLARLEQYATAAPDVALTGFWRDADLAASGG
jgi:site-specific DNA-methyltransferase (adenine-specific)